MTAAVVQARGWFRHRGLSPVVAAAYAMMVLLFLGAVARFYVPGKGFTYTIAFGSAQEPSMLSKVRRLHPYIQQQSPGYDAQFYAQIAMDPSLQNQGLPRAVDSLPYRGRRVLFAATAYVLGLGQPAWILQAFAFQNVLAWLLLGGLLLHWFPPVSWENGLRWGGVMFSSGVCISVHNALFDGPSLLLIALGVYLCEKGRPWWSTLVLGLAGLGKETNILGAVALIPAWSAGWRAWLKAAAQAVLIVLPLALWLVYIAVAIGSAADAGARNFAAPFTGFLQKWREVFVEGGTGLPPWPLMIMISLTVQFGFFVARPRWSSPWWRVGASLAILLVFLGSAVWEGYPGASARVLLPMQLAFNVLVPTGRWWRVLLIAGNLTLLSAPEALQPPPGQTCEITGARELLANADGEPVAVRLGPHWLGNEGVKNQTWTWASGSTEIVIDNPHPVALECDVEFGLATPAGGRRLTVRWNGKDIWSGELGPKITLVAVPALALQPGTNHLEFVTDEPGRKIGNDPRTLAFSLYNAKVKLRRLQPAAAH